MLTDPFLFATKLLLLTKALAAAQVLPVECCTQKMVGSVSYTLLPHVFRGDLPQQCLNDCIYTVSGTSSPMLCFKRGFASF